MKRKDGRCSAKKGLCILFSTQAAPNVGKIAEIIDISRRGLGFIYRSRQNDTQGMTAFSMMVENNIMADMIPCHSIYDFEIASNGCIPPVRRCGVQFKDLSEAQLSLIENVIQNHTRCE